MDFIRKASRDQIKMVCLADFVATDSAARQIDMVVENMDTSYFVNSELNAEGRPPYNPKDMLKLLIYGMENGVVSSRKLKRECMRNMELRWLIGELVPDAKTISDFRKNNVEHMTRFFGEFAKKLCEDGYIDGKIVSIDGTKIRANNSKRNNFSARKLDRHIEYINQKIAEYQEELDKNDRIEQLEERKAKYESYKERIANKEVTEVSVTDPDSRMMKQNNNGVDVSYNVQTAVDAKNKLIAGILVVNESNDQGQLYKTAKEVKDNLELDEMTVLGDKGYYDTDDFKSCHEDNITTIVAIPDKEEKKGNTIKVKKKVTKNSENDSTKKVETVEIYGKKMFSYDKENDCYWCPAGNKLRYSAEEKDGNRKYRSSKFCKSCPQKEKCTTGKYRTISRHKYAEHAEENDRAFKANIEVYKERQTLSEAPFGTVKRTMGIRQFQTRGLKSVTAEVALIFLTYNLKRLRVIHKNNPAKGEICLLLAQITLKLQANLNILSIQKIPNQ